MRAAGVPARVVTGYLGGEWNPIGELLHRAPVRRARVGRSVARRPRLDARRSHRRGGARAAAARHLRPAAGRSVSDSRTADPRLSLARAARDRTGMRSTSGGRKAWCSFDFGKQLESLERLGIEQPEWKHLGWALSVGLILWLAWIAWHIGAAGAALRRRIALARAYSRLCRKLATRRSCRAPSTRARSPMPPRSRASAPTSRTWRAVARALCAICATARPPMPAAFERAVDRLRTPEEPRQPFPAAVALRCSSENVPLYRRMPAELRLRMEPLVRAFLKRVSISSAATASRSRTRCASPSPCRPACSSHGTEATPTRSCAACCCIPMSSWSRRREEDEAGVVTEGTRALSGQTFDTSRIVLSWADVQESRRGGRGLQRGAARVCALPRPQHRRRAERRLSAVEARDFEHWHEVFEREYDDAVRRGGARRADAHRPLRRRASRGVLRRRHRDVLRAAARRCASAIRTSMPSSPASTGSTPPPGPEDPVTGTGLRD